MVEGDDCVDELTKIDELGSSVEELSMVNIGIDSVDKMLVTADEVDSTNEELRRLEGTLGVKVEEPSAKDEELGWMGTELESIEGEIVVLKLVWTWEEEIEDEMTFLTLLPVQTFPAADNFVRELFR